MVKPCSRSGQRRSTISFRTIRGRLGSIRVVSIARVPTPAAAASRIKFRLVVGSRDNRFRGPRCAELLRSFPVVPAYPESARSQYARIIRDQKLNVACSSNFRFAAVPGENGPPCRPLETSNRREPNTAFGLATFTLLKGCGHSGRE